MKYLVPVKFIGITRGYTVSHKALDFGWNSKIFGKNQKIYASADGIVTKVVDGKLNNMNKLIKSYGNYVDIKHDDGSLTRYAHLEMGIFVKKGNRVKQGDFIGFMGNSGYAFGNHLHFELIINHKKVNPLNSLYVNDDHIYAKSEIHKFAKISDSTYEIYVVKKGDNLTKIARKFGTTWQKIYNDNKNVIGSNPNFIKIGQELIIK